MMDSDRRDYLRNDKACRSAGSFRLTSIGLTGMLILLASAGLRPLQAWSSRGVRSSAERILSSRQYRNLQPIKRQRGSRQYRGSDQSGSESGQQGRGREENEDGRNNRGGEEGRNQGFDENRGEFSDGSGGSANSGSEYSADPEDDPDDAETGGSPQSGGAVGAFLGSVFQFIGWVFIAVVACVMVFLVVKGFMGAIAWYQNRDPRQPQTDDGPAPEGELAPETAPGELPADVYVARARALAADGRYRDAVAQLLLGAMSSIERAGWIHYRQGLTHRDYARAIRSHDTPYQSMRAMVRVYEPLGFGRRKATQQHFELSLSGYQAGFRATHSPQKT